DDVLDLRRYLGVVQTGGVAGAVRVDIARVQLGHPAALALGEQIVVADRSAQHDFVVDEVMCGRPVAAVVLGRRRVDVRVGAAGGGDIRQVLVDEVPVLGGVVKQR